VRAAGKVAPAGYDRLSSDGFLALVMKATASGIV